MDAVLETCDLRPLLERVRGEYLEMPGLRLTRPQARRLWGLDDRRCDEVLRALTHARFLTRTHEGYFIRM